MTLEPERHQLRASDLDRERVAERLREAAGDGRLDFDELDERLSAAYGAKTYGELEPLIADLPVAGRRPGAAPAPASPLPSPTPAHGGMQVTGGMTGGPAIAIFSGAQRKGRWVVPRRLQALAVFGGVELDLREATLESREVTIVASTMFGGIDITVPEGVAVRTTGAGIMGGFDGPNDDGGAPDGPVITISGVAIMGGVSIRRKPPKGTSRSKKPGHGGHPQLPGHDPRA